jgi:sensor histidine kinase YesM
MKRGLSYALMLLLLFFWLIIGGIISILKFIQKPFTRLIEYLDKLINKLNTNS